MATYEVSSPDGQKFEVTAPDTATEQEVLAYAHSQFGQTKPPNPTAGMSTTDTLLAGAGKAFTDTGRGVKQLVQSLPSELEGGAPPQQVSDIQQDRPGMMAPLQAQIDEAKRLDAPLMGTTSGKVGNIGGKIALSLPALPFAGSAVGATAVGGGLGLTEPVATGESRGANVATGAGLGLGGYGLGKLIGAGVSAAKDKIAQLASSKSQNAVKDTTLAEAREAGFNVPPSEVNPSAVSNLLERWAGKASVAQKASIDNQQATNKAVREALGLPKDAPISPETLEPIKKAAWSIYDQVKKVGSLKSDQAYDDAVKTIGDKFNGLAKEFPELANSWVEDLVKAISKKQISSEGAVEAIKAFRYQARINLSPLNTDPTKRSLGNAQSEAAEALEGLIERNLGANKADPNLIKDFKNARVSLAKVGTVERALNESTGDVSAKQLGSQLAKGKPLTGELETAARFANAYPKYVQQNVNPVPGGSPLDAATAIGTSTVTGQPGWLSLILARPLARKAVLSKMFQSQPNYTPSPLVTGASKLGFLDNQAVPTGLGLAAPSMFSE
jgi:hypothetical protein